jgi:hypothetical protein
MIPFPDTDAAVLPAMRLFIVTLLDALQCENEKFAGEAALST